MGKVWDSHLCAYQGVVKSISLRTRVSLVVLVAIPQSRGQCESLGGSRSFELGVTGVGTGRKEVACLSDVGRK